MGGTDVPMADESGDEGYARLLEDALTPGFMDDDMGSTSMVDPYAMIGDIDSPAKQKTVDSPSKWAPGVPRSMPRMIGDSHTRYLFIQ